MLEGVIFDWGGTLTSPIEVVFELDTWGRVAEHLAPERRDELVERLATMEAELWERSRTSHDAASLEQLIARSVETLGLEVTVRSLEEAMSHHLDILRPHIEHDPDARHVLEEVKGMGLKVALLSNTMWPAAFHDELLAQAGLLDLFDARLYSSEMTVTKPHPRAFTEAMERGGMERPERVVFVGDRPWDDIYGARRAGLKTVLRPNALVPPHDIEPDATITALPSLLPQLRSWLDG